MEFVGYTLQVVVILIPLIVVIKWVQLTKGRKKAYQNIKETVVEPMSDLGSVKTLEVLPLIDYYTEDNNLKTEPGVSYLIKTDDTTILMDVGFNKQKEHPSPLLQNMKALGVSVNELDSIFISHMHLDHVGGMKEQKNRQFSMSQGFQQLPEIPVYTPVQMGPSDFNPGPVEEVIQNPTKLGKGIASTGVIPRFLFLMGETLEHSLAINVENKGIVLIVGCGHQTVERIIERAKKLFKEPIYAIIGGLHFPVKQGRIMLGPINLQNVAGTDKMPWNGLNESDVENAVKAIKETNAQYVALSPHDSSDWSLDQFRTAFKEKYHEVAVGKVLKL